MIRLLGVKVILFMVLLVLLNGGLGVGYYYYLQPMRAEEERKLTDTKNYVEAKRQEVAKMKEEFVLLQSQLRNFKELEYNGFFNNQDRVLAIETLTKFSDRAGLLKAGLKVSAGEQIADPMADQANQTVIKTTITLAAKSLDDVDIYTFLKFLDQKFPGAVDIVSIKLARNEILNAAMLRKIGGGDPTALVSGDIVFDWYTMAAKDSAVPLGEGN